MKTTMWDNESVRVNRLGIIMTQMHRKNVLMSITNHQIICDIVKDKEQCHIKERKMYEFDENDLLVGTIEWEQEDIDRENEIIDLMRGDQEE